MARSGVGKSRCIGLCVACAFLLAPGLLRAQDANGPAASHPAIVPGFNLFITVQLDGDLKASGLKPGDVVEGKLLRGVFSGERELFPVGSCVRLSVDSMAVRRRVPNDHWPWVVKAFTPRHEKYPTFQSARVLLSGGGEVALRVALVSLGSERDVRAEVKQGNAGTRSEASATATANLAAQPAGEKKKIAKELGDRHANVLAQFEALVLKEDGSPELAMSPRAVAPGAAMRIAAGTTARVVLLGGISASKSQVGDAFQARLIEPVFLDSAVVLPEGSILGGKIAKKIPPRMLSRSGSILLSFTSVTIPGGTAEPIEASIAAMALDRRSHTRIDSEGELKGERPGKAWMAINLGVTAGIAKETDDALQLLLEAIVASATDVSTAGSARIAGACASGLFLLTRHGRDVVLPKFTEMEIVFDRPVPLH